MFLPVGSTVLRFSHSGKQGDKTTITMDLGSRISLFENHVKKEQEEITMLQTQWERTLSEIWECGAQILGKDAMQDLLLGPRSNQKDSGHDLPLFVPEKGDIEGPTAPLQTKHNKSVAFEEPSRAGFPRFISDASGSTVPKMAILPDVSSSQEVKELEKRINKLGTAQVAHFKKLNGDQQKWFDRRIQQLVAVWGEDA